MSQSLFAFNFRLGPWESCLNLNFDRAELAETFPAACTRDQLRILWQGNSEQFGEARSMAHALARALIHAHAFCAFPEGPVLEVEPVTWLEIRDCQTSGVISGYMHETLVRVPLDSSHPDKIQILRAVDLTQSLHRFPSFQLALADFHTARREVGPYAAFYGYRVLEDIGYHYGATKDDKPNWRVMNQALGTDKEKWNPLTNAGTWARHLSNQKLPNLQSVNRENLLILAHEAITLALGNVGVDVHRKSSSK